VATVTINRADLFPAGTTVGIYPGQARNPGNPPTAAAIATGTTDSSTGSLTVTNAALTTGVAYVAYALVNGVHTYVRARSTLDVFTGGGKAAGTATVVSGSNLLLDAIPTSGSFVAGQRITGTGIPSGTTILRARGCHLTLSAQATANGSAVAITAEGGSSWSAVQAQRRDAMLVPKTSGDVQTAPISFWHRGAGVLSEDDSLRALDVQTTYAGACDVTDGGDLRLTSDSVPVVMHDATTTRTCTTTQTVASITAATFSGLALATRAPGNPISEAPPTASQYFDKIKAKGLILAPEPKITGAAQATTDLLIAKGMQRQTIYSSSTLADLAAAKQAGMATMYIIDTAADTLGNIQAAGPDYIAFNFNRTAITDAQLQTYSAFKLLAWTIDTRGDLIATQQRLAGLGLQLWGYYTNDAAWLRNIGVPAQTTTDPFAAGLWPPGMPIGQPYNSNDVQNKFTRGVFVGSAGSYRLGLTDPDNPQSMLQGWMVPPVSSSSSLTLDITYDAVGSSTARWPGVWFNCPTDKMVYNGATSAANRGQGYLAFLRVTGSLELFREAPTDGTGSPVSLGTQATAAITSGQTATVKIEPNLPGGQIRVTRTDSGGFTPILVTDTTYRGNWVHFVKFVQAGEGLAVSFSNVNVVP
jgi:glycerophosphoryl diester phosphodiesterase